MTPRARRRNSAFPGASIVVLFACASACGDAFAQAGASGPAVDGGALQDAIAGPLVAALSDQFDGRDVDMQLERVAALPLGDGASMISGTGTVHTDGRDGRSANFSFRLPWNPWLRQAGYPDISVVGIGERNVPNDANLVTQLEADVTAALTHRLHRQAVSVRLDRVATVEESGRYLRINAQGMAYTGRGDGGTGLVILALYDRTRRAWARLEYGLGQATSGLVSR